MEYLTNDDNDNKPFESFEEAENYLANENWCGERIYFLVKDNQYSAIVSKSNALQPDGEYFYFFINVRKSI